MAKFASGDYAKTVDFHLRDPHFLIHTNSTAFLL